MRIGILESIHRYPIKSMAGESIDEAFVGFSGVMGDRVFAFTRKQGTEGFPWLTCREFEEMLQFKPLFDRAGGPVPVHLEQSFELAPGVNPVFPARGAFEVNVALPDGRRLSVGSPELAEEMAKQSGAEVELRFSERSIYDCRPISIFGNLSARELGKQLDVDLDRRRFRANFYVDWDNEQPFFENDLVGKTIQIGSRLRVAVIERDPRCKVITLDPDTGEASPRVLRHVTAQHQGFAGVYGAVMSEGTVKAGDSIHLVQHA